MCGIAGIVVRRRHCDLQIMIKEMTERVRHRGPDDEGWCVQGRVAFGHRRLSIIDLSARGHQPMVSTDGRYVITYNGEIYNYIELRSELAALGFQFFSDCDTEVILAAYATWGPECLSRFNGMWAFAIHDRKEGLIFASRDRFGVKPFYYILTDRHFAFGSEIRQLLPLLPSISACPSVLADFLLTGVQVQSPETFFEHVRTLMPGHFLRYYLQTDQCSVDRYYNLLERVNGRENYSPGEVIPKFRSLFEEAVRLRLRSDVRVGTCLSGGLDSSAIALLASRMYSKDSNRPFAAITAVSEDPRNSEENHAGQVVNAGGLAWIKSRPTYEDFRKMVPHVVRHQEEPFTTPSMCMQAFVMRAAAENNIPVLLDGQGGDETLLGYGKYHAAHCVSLLRNEGVLKALRGMRQALRHNANMNLGLYAGYLLFELSSKMRYLYYRRQNAYLARRLPRPAWIDQFASACLDIRRLQALEVETTNLPSLLRYEDKNSMAFAIETRLPFLDYRLVEYSVGLNRHFKIQDGWTKWILRKSMSDVLPYDIAWRRDKLGFEAPTELWLARHFAEMIAKIRSSPLLRRFCHSERLLRSYHRLPRKVQCRLYSVALWEEEFNVRA